MDIAVNLNNSFDDDIELSSESDHGGLIVPKHNCEHISFVQLLENIIHINKTECIDCESTKENWLCLSCGEIHCSRYVNNHGEEHWLFTLLTDELCNLGHCFTINLQDLSIWCYPCKSYIKHSRLDPLVKCLESIKSGSVPTNEYTKQIPSIIINNKQATKKNVQSPSTVIAVQNQELLDELEKTDLLSYCYTIKFRSATIDELVRLHSNDYVNMILSAEKNHSKISHRRAHLQYNETTFSDARRSAGITIDVIQNVLKTNINGLILLTSPGHRALHHHGDETSIFNNVALAINSVLRNENVSEKLKASLRCTNSSNRLDMLGATPVETAICQMIHVLGPATTIDSSNGLQTSPVMDRNNNKIQIDRVLVLDITREHGYGIQSIYYESNQVLYISIHNENHDHKSSHHDCGKNSGIGYTMNIPLSSVDTLDDRDYINIINELILPVTKEFKPDLIIVCVDFHIRQLTSLCYAWIIEQLSRIDNSKIAVVLDGDLSGISSRASYVETVLCVLIGKLSSISNDTWYNNNDINSEVSQTIDLVKQEHKQYWSCFK